jgi:hypothetical protein
VLNFVLVAQGRRRLRGQRYNGRAVVAAGCLLDVDGRRRFLALTDGVEHQECRDADKYHADQRDKLFSEIWPHARSLTRIMCSCQGVWKGRPVFWWRPVFTWAGNGIVL